MSEVDRITEDGKRAIISILNHSLETEYRHIVNFPRFIDQLININKISDQRAVWVLEHLGKDSIRHANIVMHLVEQLGGESHLEFGTVERMSNIDDCLRHQLEKERESLLLFQKAKAVAKSNQMNKSKGIFDSFFRTIRDKQEDKVKGSAVIELLTSLAQDEEGHISLLKEIMTRLNIEA